MAKKKRKRRAPPATGYRRSKGSGSDWVWGLGVAVFALGIVGVVALYASGLAQSGGVGCGDPLPRLGEEPLTRESFVQANTGISQVISDINRRAVEDAESAFFIDVHLFVHTLNSDIRPQNEELAKELCESVLFLEEEFAQQFGHDFLNLTLRAETIRSLFTEAESELQLSEP